MKNYRLIVAIALVALMVVSIFSMFSNAAQKSAELNAYVEKAQVYAEEGLLDKAAEQYSAAIALHPDVNYYNIASDLYYEDGAYADSISWAEEAVDAFPEEPSGYARVIRGYLATRYYDSAFEALAAYDGRKLQSEEVEQYRDEMMSLYTLSVFSVEDVAQSSSGYCAVYKNEVWGIATAKGKTFLKPAYTKVGYMANDVVAVCDAEGTWYFADADGLLVQNLSNHIEGDIAEVGLYNNGLFAVSDGTTYTYYDGDLNARFGGYDYAGAFNNEVAAVKKGEAWSLINTEGNVISSTTYDEIVTDYRGICCQKGIVIAKSGDRYILLDSAGKQIGSAAFENGKVPVNGDLFAVMQNGKWGFADLQGNIVIEPQYENACSFSNGYAAVCIDGLWGYIDESNTLRIPAEFTECRNMSSSGIAFVKQETGWQILKLYWKNY